jgi:hypothetical protein
MGSQVVGARDAPVGEVSRGAVAGRDALSGQVTARVVKLITRVVKCYLLGMPLRKSKGRGAIAGAIATIGSMLA